MPGSTSAARRAGWGSPGTSGKAPASRHTARLATEAPTTAAPRGGLPEAPRGRLTRGRPGRVHPPFYHSRGGALTGRGRAKSCERGRAPSVNDVPAAVAVPTPTRPDGRLRAVGGTARLARSLSQALFVAAPEAALHGPEGSQRGVCGQPQCFTKATSTWLSLAPVQRLGSHPFFEA